MSKHAPKELETLLENKHHAEEAKAEMLEHNPLLKFHAEEAAAPVASNSNDTEDERMEAAPQGYIKDPEDMARIARNKFNDKVVALPKTDALQQMLEFQLSAMNQFVDVWFSMLGASARSSR
jgi:hypothetical protein